MTLMTFDKLSNSFHIGAVYAGAIGKPHVFAPVPFWSKGAIIVLIAFTKCTPSPASFAHIRRAGRWFDSYLIIPHFKMLDKGTILFF